MKYRLIKNVKETPWGKETIDSLYRLVALRDIPLYGVQEGDLGGLVSAESVLSQYDDCWISHNAKVTGNVFIVDNAYIGESARITGKSEKYSIMITGTATIKGNARISTSEDNEAFQNVFITDKVRIYGSPLIQDCGRISNNVTIQGSVVISGSKEISGDSALFENAKLNKGVKVLGRSNIFGNAIIRTGAVIENSRVAGNANIPVNVHLKDGDVDSEGFLKSGQWNLLDNAVTAGSSGEQKFYSSPPPPNFSEPIKTVSPVLDTATKDALNLLEEVKHDLAVYETDIVKIIKYPVMTDRTNSYTLEMMQALKLANRLALNPSHTGFVASVFDLEKKFLAAESNALKMASSGLNELELKKAGRASDLLAIASDEASTEQEKKLAFKQAFKQLEGVIMVPEAAMETFKIKIGLPELEA